jgi:hypothetical protein
MKLANVEICHIETTVLYALKKMRILLLFGVLMKACFSLAARIKLSVILPNIIQKGIDCMATSTFHENIEIDQQAAKIIVKGLAGPKACLKTP